MRPWWYVTKIINYRKSYVCCELSFGCYFTCFLINISKKNCLFVSFTLLVSGNTELYYENCPCMVHLELPLVHAKSLWTRRNFELQVAPGSRRLISRLGYVLSFEYVNKIQLTIVHVYHTVSTNSKWIHCTTIFVICRSDVTLEKIGDRHNF